VRGSSEWSSHGPARRGLCREGWIVLRGIRAGRTDGVVCGLSACPWARIAVRVPGAGSLLAASRCWAGPSGGPDSWLSSVGQDAPILLVDPDEQSDIGALDHGAGLRLRTGHTVYLLPAHIGSPNRFAPASESQSQTGKIKLSP